MTYKIEITDVTTAELAGKLLALAAAMQVDDARDYAPVEGAPKPRASRKKAAEAVAVEPVAEQSEPVAEQSEPAAESPLDFDRDVAPVVIRAVKQRGREYVQDILAQFGVERASQVPDEEMRELVALVAAGLE